MTGNFAHIWVSYSPAGCWLLVGSVHMATNEAVPTGTTRKYYQREHERGYAQMVARGLTSWDALHGSENGFEHFSSRWFLERTLPRLPPVQGGGTGTVLELGCGTGPGACFMAQRGWRAHGVDLIPAAVSKAREMAAQLGLTELTSFEVRDIAAPAAAAHPKDIGTQQQYDVVLDSFCSQGIVLQSDRSRMLELIRTALRPSGLLLSSCVHLNPARWSADAPPVAKGYHASTQEGEAVDLWQFDEDQLFDPVSQICYEPVEASEQGEYDGMITVERVVDDCSGGAASLTSCCYLGTRCYRTATSLRSELTAHGFRVVHEEPGPFPGAGNVVAVVDSAEYYVELS